jgi:sugar O-acyltransferase (sialic acid O-acetyltransferase NeuD family)
MTKLVLLGTGMLAEVLAEQADDTAGLELVAFAENLDRGKVGGEIAGRPIVWVDDLPKAADVRAVCAISTTQRERYVEQVRALGIRFGQLVSPRAHISRSVQLAEGVVIQPVAGLGPFCRLGRHVMINRHVQVGHHVRFGDYSTVQLGAIVAGASRIEPRAYIALGAKVMDRLTVGEGALVGAGALVTKDVAPHTQVMGVPARPVRGGVTGR